MGCATTKRMDSKYFFVDCNYLLLWRTLIISGNEMLQAQPYIPRKTINKVLESREFCKM